MCNTFVFLCLFYLGIKAIDGLPVELRSARREPSSLLKLDGDSDYRLRWISLHGFSSEYLPNGFNLRHAIAIHLKHSLGLVLKETEVFITCLFLLKQKQKLTTVSFFYFVL